MTRVSLVLCVVFAASGCATSASSASEPSSGATPTVLTSVAEEEKELIGRYGVLSVSDGCLLLDEVGVLAWPAGTTWDASTNEVVMEDGTRLREGDAVQASGIPVRNLDVVLGSDGARAAAACGGVGVESGLEAPSGQRGVLDGAGPKV